MFFNFFYAGQTIYSRLMHSSQDKSENQEKFEFSSNNGLVVVSHEPDIVGERDREAGKWEGSIQILPSSIINLDNSQAHIILQPTNTHTYNRSQTLQG